MANNSYNTIGYIQSKMIRTPLHLHTEWNGEVNKCKDHTELYDLCQHDGTDEDVEGLMSLIDKA